MCGFLKIVVRRWLVCVFIIDASFSCFSSILFSAQFGRGLWWHVLRSCGGCCVLLDSPVLCPDVDQLPDDRNIQAWVEVSEQDVVISGGRVFLLGTALVPYKRTSADLEAFEQYMKECLGLFLFLGVSILASQWLSWKVCRFFSSLLSWEILTRPKEALVAPLLGVCPRLRENGGSLPLK